MPNAHDMCGVGKPPARSGEAMNTVGDEDEWRMAWHDTGSKVGGNLDTGTGRFLKGRKPQ